MWPRSLGGVNCVVLAAVCPYISGTLYVQKFHLENPQRALWRDSLILNTATYNKQL